MKILYFLVNLEGNPNCGVHKKIFSQASILMELGMDVKVIILTPNSDKYPNYSFLTVYQFKDLRKENIFGMFHYARIFAHFLKKSIDSLGKEDILYYRFLSSIPFFYPLNYFKFFRRCILITEHNDIEVGKAKSNNNVISFYFERLFGPIIRGQSDGIVGVTNEICQHQKGLLLNRYTPDITIGNGFDVHSVPVRNPPKFCGDEIHFICVANVHLWHGLDRFLEGLKVYTGFPRVILHIAGEGPEVPNLKRLVDELNIKDRVIFHGFVTGKDIDCLYDKCHIALGSLGIHRKLLSMTSELKARDYCSRGIPFIVSCGDPDFPFDFSYILQIPADESPINIERVIAFAQKISAEYDHPQQMRKYAETHLDWSIKMRKLTEFLKCIVIEKVKSRYT
jgi:glycosyltransferase involved in cell wall biosynthesis